MKRRELASRRSFLLTAPAEPPASGRPRLGTNAAGSRVRSSRPTSTSAGDWPRKCFNGASILCPRQDRRVAKPDQLAQPMSCLMRLRTPVARHYGQAALNAAGAVVSLAVPIPEAVAFSGASKLSSSNRLSPSQRRIRGVRSGSRRWRVRIIEAPVPQSIERLLDVFSTRDRRCSRRSRKLGRCRPG